MTKIPTSFVYASVLSIALIGVVGCDMSEYDPDSGDEEPLVNEIVDEQGVDEDSVDPGLAMEIAKQKLALLDDGSITPQHNAPCGTTPPDDDPKEVVADAASPNAANQRSGSSTSCAILGVLQPSDDADYHCFTCGSTTPCWTYLRNIRTGVRGWVRDDLLRDFGSSVHCNF